MFKQPSHGLSHVTCLCGRQVESQDALHRHVEQLPKLKRWVIVFTSFWFAYGLVAGLFVLASAANEHINGWVGIAVGSAIGVCIALASILIVAAHIKRSCGSAEVPR